MEKEKKFKQRINIIIFFLCFSILAQNPEYSDMLEWEAILNAPPENLSIIAFFSRHENIYLVVYDAKGYEFYIQFKEDVYDDRNDKQKRHFVPGQKYKLNLKFIGIILKNQFYSKNEITRIEIPQDESIHLIFSLISFEPIILNEIHF